MSDDARLEQVLARMLADTAASRAPDRLRTEITSSTSRARQRPHWLASLKEPPMRYRSRLAVGAPALRLGMVAGVTGALLLALAAAAIAGATLQPRPPAFANGIIAFDAEYDIWLVRQDGSGLTNLTHTPRQNESSPVWSPDGRRIAYWMSDDRYADTGTGRVAIMDAGGTLERTLTSPPGAVVAGDCLGGLALWSPDGERIAVPARVPTSGSGNRHGLVIFDLVSGDAQVPEVATDICGFQWSPDGRSIVYNRDASDGGVHIVPLDGGQDELLTPLSAFASVTGDDGKPFTSDGRTIVFTRQSGTGRDADIAVVGIDGSGERTLVGGPDNDYEASVAPDGRSVVFLRAPFPSMHVANKTNTVEVASIDGTGVEEVAKDVCRCTPSWSPDGTRLATWDPSVANVIIVTVDGSEAPVKVPSHANLGVLSWQPPPR